MGLEKVVLSKIEDTNGAIYDNAEFFNGTLFIRKDDTYEFKHLWYVAHVLETALSCRVRMTDCGDQYSIDFV